VFVILAFMIPAVNAQAEKTAYVKTNSIKVYASASTSSEKLGTLNFGESITYVSKKGSWAKVQSDDGRTGFCKLSALTATNPNGNAKTYYAKQDGVTAYKRTSVSSTALKQFDRNAAVSVVAVTPDKKWCRVTQDGAYGFVQVSDLSKTKGMDPFTVYIAKNTVQFYKSASKSSSKVGVMSYGESLTCIKIDGDWAQLQNGNGKKGWCKKTQLTKENPNVSAVTCYASASLRAYARPDTGTKELAQFAEGDELSAVAVTPDGDWVRLALGSGYGYAEVSAIAEDKPKDDTAPNAAAQGEAEVVTYDDSGKGTADGTLEKVIALAVQQYGKPYVYATHGPDTFDCSGLTSYCFGTVAGVSLSRSAYGQGYDNRFQKIETIGALARGDVVCFNTVASDIDLSDHVGIYLGGGKFIHASSGAGKVIVSTLASGYYNRTFSWGLRVGQ
jgi:cell wall-associated NlpC family hydrolase